MTKGIEYNNSSNLLKIHPLGESRIYNPITGSSCLLEDWVIAGDHTMGQISNSEGAPLLVPLPYHQGIISSFVFSKNKQTATPSDYWNSIKFSNHYKNPTQEDALIRKSGPAKLDASKGTIVLNCLTPYFGDAVSLLFRCQLVRDKYPSHNLVVIVPKNIEFLVPDFICQVWVFKLSLGKAGDWNLSMAETIKTWVHDLGTHVYIPLIFEPVGLDANSVTNFTKHAPFPIDYWDKRLEECAHVTFVARTDRMWSPELPRTPLHPRILQILSYERTIKHVESYIQNIRFIKLAKILKKRFKKINIRIIGQGKPISSKYFDDLRREKFDRSYEMEMIKICAESHTVVGTHGSHMILPTALAGSSIHIHNDSFEFHDLLDCVVTEQNPRLAIIRHQRHLNSSSSNFIANKVTKLLINTSIHEVIFSDNFSDPPPEGLEKFIFKHRTQRTKALSEQDTGNWGKLLYDCSCYFN
jgi:hypothetical protein